VGRVHDRKNERALVLLYHRNVSFFYGTFVVIGTRHMNKSLWDMLNRVLRYENNIWTEYIFDPDLFDTDKVLLLFKTECSFKIAGF